MKRISERIKDSEFRHSYFYIDPKFSTNRKYSAGVRVDMNEGYATISILLHSLLTNETKTFELIRLHPNRILIKEVIAKAKWLNNDVFEVVDKSRQIHFILTLSRESVELNFTPTSKSEAELVDEILLYSLGKMPDLIKKIGKDKLDSFDA